MKRLYTFTFTVALVFILNGCVQVNPYPPPGTSPPPPPPPKQEPKWIDKNFNLGKNSFHVHVTGQSRDPNKYRICLRNSAGGKNKGMDWKSGRKPVFIAKKRGQIVCHEYNPRTVAWKFYRIQGLKGYQNIGSYTFNAYNYKGKEITFDWLRD
jgi:hypothetical protein